MEGVREFDPGLPTDAELVRHYQLPARDSIVLIIESEEFDEVELDMYDEEFAIPEFGSIKITEHNEPTTTK